MLLWDSFLTNLDNADGVHRTIGGRYRHSAFSHQFTDERGGFGPRDRGLYSYSDQTVGVIQYLEGVTGENRTKIFGITAAAIARVQPGAVIDQEFDDFVSAL